MEKVKAFWNSVKPKLLAAWNWAGGQFSKKPKTTAVVAFVLGFLFGLKF